MSYLLDHHLAVVDPFRLGFSSAPLLGLLMPIPRGCSFPWRDGCVALLRRALYPDVHEWVYCGLALGDDTTLKNFPGMGHSASQAYQYTAVVMLGQGMISTAFEPTRVDFDGGKALITPRLPTFPVHVTAKATDGGKFRIAWEYDPAGQGGFPTDFQVFEGVDAGSVDYNTPLTDSQTGLDVVTYSGSRRIYALTTAAYGDLTWHVFSVRARNVNGVAELNTYTTTSRRARSAAPAAAAAPESVHVTPHSLRAG